ncbi:MAG: redoxin family protein [Candidatus Eremiobacteraeota bacterium]|nr:redoxin family protein [Candidatus Eremiobacteraeota bacterium]MBC5826081.1 redoxin family protein [Candidatus Eremiobacteraeota bacterium]
MHAPADDGHAEAPEAKPARRRPTSFPSWALAFVLFAIAVLVWRHAVRPPALGVGALQAGRARVGMPSPDFALSRLDGRRTALSAFKGHPLFVSFFATWCPPCKAELPDIERHYQAEKAKGLVVLGVDQQESPAAVVQFARLHGLTFPLAIDAGQGALTYDLNAIPTSVFIDARGIVRAIHVGQISTGEMDAALRQIL